MFEAREMAEEHKVRTGETLESLAREAGITWQQLAEFNWGTSKPRQVNVHLVDDVGCTHRDAAGNYRFDDTDDPGIVLLPQKFKREGLAARQVHTIHVRAPSHEDQLVDCFGLPGATFRFGRSFIRPNTIPWIAEILNKAEEHPAAKLCVFGHTDSADDARDNKRLSERRAWALWAVLANDAQAWVTLCDHAAERWDEREFRRVYDAIGATGSGKPSRAQYEDYFAVLREGRDPLPRSRFLKSGAVDGFMGCGEYNHLVRNVTPHSDPVNQAKNEPNRRAVVFFFDGSRPPRLPCLYNDIGPCTKHGAREGADRAKGVAFSCAVYDRIGRECDCELSGIIETEPTFDLRYQVKDARGRVIAKHGYTLELSDGSQRKGQTDAQGLAIEFDVPPGEASLQLDGFSHIDEDLTDERVPDEWAAGEDEPLDEADGCGM